LDELIAAKEAGYAEREALRKVDLVLGDDRPKAIEYYMLQEVADYAGITVSEDYLRNYMLLRMIYGSNDVDLIRDIVAEASRNNRDIEQLITGIVDSDYQVRAPYNKLPGDGTAMPKVKFMYLGGAGKRATDFAQMILKRYTDKPGYKDFEKLVLVSVCSISDEGGHIRKLEDGLLNSNEFWWYAIPTGDIVVYPVKFALDDLKKEILTEQRLNSYSCEIGVLGNICEALKDHKHFPQDKYPKDLLFFITNNLSMARKIDQEWVKPGIAKIDSASWQNLFYAMARLVTGEVEQGNTEANEATSMRLEYEIMGSKSGYAVPSSYTASPQAVLLEGFAVGVEKKDGNDRLVHYVTIARDEETGEYYALESKTEGIIRPEMVIGNPQAVKLTNTPVVFKRHGQEFEVSVIADNQVKVVVEGKEYIFSENEAFDTLARSNGAATTLFTDTFWTPLKDLGEDTTFVAKSRLVRGQDKITDAAEYHPAVLKQGIFIDLVRDDRGWVEYEAIDEEHVDRFEDLFGRKDDRKYTTRDSYPDAAKKGN